MSKDQRWQGTLRINLRNAQDEVRQLPLVESSCHYDEGSLALLNRHRIRDRHSSRGQRLSQRALVVVQPTLERRDPLLPKQSDSPSIRSKCLVLSGMVHPASKQALEVLTCCRAILDSSFHF